MLPTGLNITLKILVVICGMFLVYYLRNVLLPFAVAFMLAYLLNPVVTFFQRIVKKRWIAVILTLLSFLTICFGIILIVLPKVFVEAKHLYDMIVYRNALSEWTENLPTFILDYINQLSYNQDLTDIFGSNNIATMLESLLPKITSLLGQTYNLITSILGFAFIILYLIFIMLDYDNLSKGINKMIPMKYKHKFNIFFRRFSSEVRKYFRGQISIVFIVTILYSFGFWIVDLPMGIGLGILVGTLNIVPYCQIIGFFPAILLCAVKSMEDNIPLWIVLLTVAAVFIVVQILQDAIITPKIMGKTTGLNPAMILLSLSIWGKLLGFLGLIVAIPFSCLVKIYYAEFIARHDKKYHNEDNETTQ